MDQRIAVRYAQAAMSPPDLANCLTRPLQDRAPDQSSIVRRRGRCSAANMAQFPNEESTVYEKRSARWTPLDQGRSNKSRFMTLCHADTKSLTNSSSPSWLAYTSEIARSMGSAAKARSTRLAIPLTSPVH